MYVVTVIYESFGVIFEAFWSKSATVFWFSWRGVIQSVSLKSQHIRPLVFGHCLFPTNAFGWSQEFLQRCQPVTFRIEPCVCWKTQHHIFTHPQEPPSFSYIYSAESTSYMMKRTYRSLFTRYSSLRTSLLSTACVIMHSVNKNCRRITVYALGGGLWYLKGGTLVTHAWKEWRIDGKPQPGHTVCWDEFKLGSCRIRSVDLFT